jgi:hypothetical protein
VSGKCPSQADGSFARQLERASAGIVGSDLARAPTRTLTPTATEMVDPISAHPILAAGWRAGHRLNSALDQMRRAACDDTRVTGHRVIVKWMGSEVETLADLLPAIRDVELALHVPVIGDTVASFMAPPDTDPAALRAADSLAILPDDPAAAAEEIQRRREQIGFSYFVFGADFADALAPVVAELAGH